MSNPLLAKVKLPGRVFQLPSKGIFYEAGILSEKASKEGEIEVKAMSALSEITLKSADLLYTGRALQEICNECVPDIIKSDKLSTKDVDALFIFLRMATYGNLFEVTSTHDCDNAEKHSYMIPLEEIIATPNNESLNGSVDILFSIKLENQQEVKLKPISFEDSMTIIHKSQQIDAKINNNDVDGYGKAVGELTLFDTFCIIKSVDNIMDRNMIKEWLDTVPKPYINAIQKQYKEAMNWGFNLTYDLTCKDCKTKYQFDLELNPISFFSG